MLCLARRAWWHGCFSPTYQCTTLYFEILYAFPQLYCLHLLQLFLAVPFSQQYQSLVHFYFFCSGYSVEMLRSLFRTDVTEQGRKCLYSQEFTFIWWRVCVCVIAFPIIHSTNSLFSFLPVSCTVGRASRLDIRQSLNQTLKYPNSVQNVPYDLPCDNAILLFSY